MTEKPLNDRAAENTHNRTAQKQIEPTVMSNNSATLKAAPSRRGLLGGLAAIGGIGGVVAWFGVPNIGSSSLVGEDRPSDDDQELLSDQEAVFRSQLHNDQMSMIPAFAYDPIIEEYNGSKGIKQVVAKPADGTSGDRLIIGGTNEVATTTEELLVSRWGGSGDSRQYSTVIDGDSVAFELYVGSELVLGVTIRNFSSINQAEILAARSTEISAVKELIDSYSSFYAEHML